MLGAKKTIAPLLAMILLGTTLIAVMVAQGERGVGKGSLFCCDGAFSPAGTKTHYDIPVGVPVSARIDSATDAGSPLPATTAIFVKSTMFGNTQVVGTREGTTSNYSFTYSAPTLAQNGFDVCGTTLVAYNAVGLNANNDYRDDGRKKQHR